MENINSKDRYLDRNAASELQVGYQEELIEKVNTPEENLETAQKMEEISNQMQAGARFLDMQLDENGNIKDQKKYDMIMNQYTKLQEQYYSLSSSLPDNFQNKENFDSDQNLQYEEKKAA